MSTRLSYFENSAVVYDLIRYDVFIMISTNQKHIWFWGPLFPREGLVGYLNTMVIGALAFKFGVTQTTVLNMKDNIYIYYIYISSPAQLAAHRKLVQYNN